MTTTALPSALAGAGMVLAGWFAPAWCVPASAAACALVWTSGRVRRAAGWGTPALAAGVAAAAGVKDMLLPGPLGRAAADLGVASGWPARQPDLAAAARAAAAAGICVFAFQLLRVMPAGARAGRAWMRGVVPASAGLAALVLTAPHAAADYGKSFMVGELVNRNAAAGAFALAAILAGGLAAGAMRAGRTREWPAALLAMAVCVFAVAELGSRGGLLALLAGAIYLAARSGGSRVRRWVLPAGVLAVGALLIAPSTVARLGNLGGEYRLELWAGSLRALSQAPFGGVGGGGFAEAFALFGGHRPEEGMRVTHPDSSWVLLLTEWGAAGVLALAGAAWWLLRSRGEVADRELKVTAEAGVIVWAVAAVGDISFHRPALMVVGLPLLAMAWPAGTGATDGVRRRGLAAAGGAVALLLGGFSLWARQEDRAADTPARIDARMAEARPLDMRVNHALGFDALNRGDYAEATRRFAAAVAVDPSNTEALRVYARSLMAVSPELALPFWRRLFLAANQRAVFFLVEELKNDGAADRVFWMKAVEPRPELWAILADSDEAGAQRCYERWRMSSGETRSRSPRWAVPGAIARWGGVADMNDWLAKAPKATPMEALNGARALMTRGRSDLAWAWLARLFPEPPAEMVAEPDAGLRARVLASPDDHVAASRLLAQTTDEAARLRLLREWSGRPGAPATFRIQLAYTLRKNGLHAEALEMMMDAAKTVAAGS